MSRAFSCQINRILTVFPSFLIVFKQEKCLSEAEARAAAKAAKNKRKRERKKNKNAAGNSGAGDEANSNGKKDDENQGPQNWENQENEDEKEEENVVILTEIRKEEFAAPGKFLFSFASFRIRAFSGN